jgi:hypothetical protein
MTHKVGARETDNGCRPWFAVLLEDVRTAGVSEAARRLPKRCGASRIRRVLTDRRRFPGTPPILRTRVPPVAPSSVNASPSARALFESRCAIRATGGFFTQDSPRGFVVRSPIARATAWPRDEPDRRRCARPPRATRLAIHASAPPPAMCWWRLRWAPDGTRDRSEIRVGRLIRGAPRSKPGRDGGPR